MYNAAASSSFKANGAYLASENPLLPARPDLLGILSTDTLGIAGLQVKSFTFGQVIKFQDNSYLMTVDWGWAVFALDLFEDQKYSLQLWLNDWSLGPFSPST